MGIADVFAAPSISVKLSALHPRYELAKRARVMRRTGAARARTRAAGASRRASASPSTPRKPTASNSRSTSSPPRMPIASLDGWEGYGLAVQAYQKRAPFVLDCLADLARRTGRRMPVRLVKGAYWDSARSSARRSTARRATRCSRASRTPTSATSPARAACSTRPTRSTRCSPRTTRRRSRRSTHYARNGAGAGLRVPAPARHGRRPVRRSDRPDRLDVPCRVYAPVGSHEDLLPYLVRRLLENGANSQLRQPHHRRVASRSTTSSPIRSPPSTASTPSRIRASRSRAIFRAHDSEELHGRQPRQRRTSCARSPTGSTPPCKPLERGAAGAGRDAPRRRRSP